MVLYNGKIAQKNCSGAFRGMNGPLAVEVSLSTTRTDSTLNPDALRKATRELWWLAQAKIRAQTVALAEGRRAEGEVIIRGWGHAAVRPISDAAGRL